MLGLHLNFDEYPKIGFAHHFHMDNYRQSYGEKVRSFEIVYTKTGGITAKLYGKEYFIEPGSVMVLFRDLPIELVSADGTAQTHCTIHVLMDCEMELVEDYEKIDINAGGIVVPFIVPPCSENEKIKKELYSIISNAAGSANRNSLSISLSVLSILARLDRLYRQKLYGKKSASSLLEYKIKRYISDHMDSDIPLSEIAEYLGKSPNYLNSVFKSVVGMGIHQYINCEKVRMICELMENVHMSFKEACENVAIYDVSYGYRLFKKQTGVTPKAYLAGERMSR